MDTNMDIKTRINQIKQPYGGYLNPNLMRSDKYDGDILPIMGELVSPGIVSTTVNGLTKLMTGGNLIDSFKDSIRGYAIAKYAKKSEMINISLPEISIILNKIKDLSDYSITSAVKLSTFQIWFLNSVLAQTYAKDVKDVYLDSYTLNHIRIMVRRGIDFFNNWGGVVRSSVQATLDDGLIKKADIDYLTTKEVWNMCVSSNTKINSKKTLEILVEYLLAKKTNKEEFSSLNGMGIFNPRLNNCWNILADEIPDDVIKAVEGEVLGYRRDERLNPRNVF